MRGYIYDVASLGLIVLSLFFFYKSVDFLSENNYIASVISMIIGFMIARVGVELSKISLVAEQDRQQS